MNDNIWNSKKIIQLVQPAVPMWAVGHVETETTVTKTFASVIALALVEGKGGGQDIIPVTMSCDGLFSYEDDEIAYAVPPHAVHFPEQGWWEITTEKFDG